MEHLITQSKLNKALVKGEYKKAWKLYNQMNELREGNGLARLVLPNLESKFKN